MTTMITIPEHNLGNYIVPKECKKKVCVDIGANIGDFVIKAANEFETLHFYEPYIPCFQKILEKTINYNNIVGWNEAVYKTDNEVVSIVAHFNNDAGSNAIKTDVLNNDWRDEIQEVKTVSLPTILKRVGGHINYLKVDCETSEYYLFMGQDLTEIDYIGIELHCQIGKNKYDELISHIYKTHTSNQNYDWVEDNNKEVLFINNKIL